MPSTAFAVVVCLSVSVIAAALFIRPSSHDAAPPRPPEGRTLVFYDWAEDMPESVIADFELEFGVRVLYETFDSMSEAAQLLASGAAVDVAVIDNEQIPDLIRQGVLLPIDYSAVFNMRYIGPNFRDLLYDPRNTHSVPFNWGTTALLVRPDLVESPVTSWADLWRDDLRGKVGVRGDQREIMAAALKSLGYSINTELFSLSPSMRGVFHDWVSPILVDI